MQVGEIVASLWAIFVNRTSVVIAEKGAGRSIENKGAIRFKADKAFLKFFLCKLQSVREASDVPLVQNHLQCFATVAARETINAAPDFIGDFLHYKIERTVGERKPGFQKVTKAKVFRFVMSRIAFNECNLANEGIGIHGKEFSRKDEKEDALREKAKGVLFSSEEDPRGKKPTYFRRRKKPAPQTPMPRKRAIDPGSGTAVVPGEKLRVPSGSKLKLPTPLLSQGRRLPVT